MYNIKYYHHEFKKHNVYENFENPEYPLNAVLNLQYYFKSRQDLDMHYFNEKEASHLADVKGLIQNSYIIYYFSFLFLLIYFNKNILSDLFLYSGILTIFFILLIALIYLITGFDFLFLKFHQIFFTGNYSFDPVISNMKAMFPDAFFFDMALAILIRTLIKGILLIIISLIIKKKLFFLHPFKRS